MTGLQVPETLWIRNIIALFVKNLSKQTLLPLKVDMIIAKPDTLSLDYNYNI